MFDEDLDSKVTKITPIYDYKNVSGGYFELYFDDDDTFPMKLSYIPFLDHRVKSDDNLFEYLKKISTKDENFTCSHAIYELYDLGFPVDDWVREYVEMAKVNVSADLFNTLMHFYMHLKNFGNESSGSYE